MEKTFFIKIQLPTRENEQREIFSQLILRIASRLSFQGMQDWQVELSKSKKILGTESEFHDLTKSAKISNEIVVHFFQKKDAILFAKILKNTFTDIRISQPKQLAHKDWMKEWRKHYKIQTIKYKNKKVAIVPAWKKSPKRIPSVRIYPGQAFGTGTHPTTRLCIQTFLSLEFSKPMKILDFGAGTGILALSAEKMLGKDHCTSIIAVESDPIALNQGKKNIRLNRSKILFQKKVPSNKKFHFIFANVLAPVLLQYKKILLQSVLPGGRLLLSGLLTKEYKTFLHDFMLQQKDWVVEQVNQQEDWCAILLRKKK